MPDYPPNRLWLHQLVDLLAWFEANLCNVQVKDPRDHVVKFTPERFPHIIKLCKKGSNKPVDEPQKQVSEIRQGKKTNADFGGYDAHRAQTMTWIKPTIESPTKILELVSQPLVGPKKAGDTVYIKEFVRNAKTYRRLFVCKRVGSTLLIPVTCHPRDHARFSANYKQVWPPLP